MPEHGETDALGVVTTALDSGAKSTLKGRRLRERPGNPLPIDALPLDWRKLLTRWARHGERCKWDSLLKRAGTRQVEAAVSLLDWLLQNGWVEVEEQRQLSTWRPLWVRFREVSALRRALGLKDADAEAARWNGLRGDLENTLPPTLAPLLATLDALPVARALARGDLVHALANWIAENRSGTQRDFALYARGTTKAVTSAEWAWLAAEIDLADCGIERHTPTLLLASSATLEFDAGAWLLAAAADFAALTPATLARVKHIARPPLEWLLVENRTSFEREARTRHADTALVWLPGHPPTWWRDAMRLLLSLAPAPARIACDPDPAGIEIALAASRLWDEQGLAWTPWKMDGAALAALPARRALNDWDRSRIESLREQPGLPAAFVDLLAEMERRGEKGEQEGLEPAQPSATTSSTASP